MIRAVAVACLLLFAFPVSAPAKPNCGAWGAPTPQGKKTKTFDGVKHPCDASSKSRSCCELGQQTKCWNETQTSYENCTPARTAPGKTQNFKIQTPQILRR